MSYKAIEIYKDLPQTNCKECGKPGCFQFGLAVYLNELKMNQCPHLDQDRLSVMLDKLEAGRDSGEGKAPPNHQQALARLLEVMREADMKKMADLAGCEYSDQSGVENIAVILFGNLFNVEREVLHPPEGRDENIWEKVLILLYLTMSKGSQPIGRWTAFRELPNTISKAKNFEDECERLAKELSKITGSDNQLKVLDKALDKLGGVVIDPESADRAYEIQALPRVKLRVIFWAEDDEFSSRCSILMDKGVLDYLDQEATVFLAEVFVNSVIDLLDIA